MLAHSAECFWLAADSAPYDGAPIALAGSAPALDASCLPAIAAEDLSDCSLTSGGDRSIARIELQLCKLTLSRSALQYLIFNPRHASAGTTPSGSHRCAASCA